MKIVVKDGKAELYDGRQEDINYLNWLIDYFCFTRKEIKKLIDLAHTFCPEDIND